MMNMSGSPRYIMFRLFNCVPVGGSTKLLGHDVTVECE